jgi:hypothetical protein
LSVPCVPSKSNLESYVAQWLLSTDTFVVFCRKFRWGVILHMSIHSTLFNSIMALCPLHESWAYVLMCRYHKIHNFYEYEP